MKQQEKMKRSEKYKTMFSKAVDEEDWLGEQKEDCLGAYKNKKK